MLICSFLWLCKNIRRHFHSTPPGEALNHRLPARDVSNVGILRTSGLNMWNGKSRITRIFAKKLEIFWKLGSNGFATMGKLNVVILRYLSREDFRVLTAVCIILKRSYLFTSTFLPALFLTIIWSATGVCVWSKIKIQPLAESILNCWVCIIVSWHINVTLVHVLFMKLDPLDVSPI